MANFNRHLAEVAVPVGCRHMAINAHNPGVQWAVMRTNLRVTVAFVCLAIAVLLQEAESRLA